MTTVYLTTVHCPGCSSVADFEGSTDQLQAAGFVFNGDGAWEKICARCEHAAVTRSNHEYEGLMRAAAELSKLHFTSPPTSILIPPDEGFDHAGQRHYGFWAAGRSYTDGGFSVFVRAARSIVDRINEAQGTGLVVNVNAGHTQMIVHGFVE